MIHVVVVCVDIPYNQHHHGLLHHADARKRSALSCDLHKVWVAAAFRAGMCQGWCCNCRWLWRQRLWLLATATVCQQAWLSSPLLTIHACWRDLSVLGVAARGGLGIWYVGVVGRRRWRVAAVTADCVLGCACRQSAAGCRACCALPWTACVPLWRLVSALQGSA